MRANLMQVTKHVAGRGVLNTVLLIAILSVLGCGPPGTAPRESAETPSAPVEGTPLSYEAVLCINEARINVLVADTPQERAAGLSGYAGLPEDAGMLFVFPGASAAVILDEGHGVRARHNLDTRRNRGTNRCLDPAPDPEYAGRPTPALSADPTYHARTGTNRRFGRPIRYHHRQPHSVLPRGDTQEQ